MRFIRQFLAALLTTIGAVVVLAGPASADAPDSPDPDSSFLGHFTTSTVLATPLSSDPAVCRTTTVTLAAGTYNHGTRYHYDGDSYDHEGLTVPAGVYTWTDCLLPTPDTYIQLSRLRPAPIPDIGPDLSTIAHLRDPPSSTQPVQWGSFLERTE